jgi:glycosyltransferase involved in cell wall biosynthesis
MLKVLQVIPTLDRSGAEKQMVLLATGLPRDRFHVEVAALTRLGPLKADLDAAGIPVTLFGKRLKLDAVTLARLARFMIKGRFDIVQTWIFAANTYGRMAAHMAKVPVVVTSEMAVDLWKGRSQLRVDRWLAGWTDRIVGNSRAVVDFYHKVGKIPRDYMTLIYSGIADEEPPPIDPAEIRRELDIDPNAPLLLYAGRLAAQKNVADLIDAADLLQHVEPRAVTLIAGDGPLHEQLTERARSYSLLDSGRLRFLGHCDDVPRLLAAADILVLPSSYEGLPNVVLEAMRFRKPVVATAAPGTTELVIDKETGLLVPIGNPTDLTRALRTLIRDPALRAHLGQAGRHRVEQNFTARAMINQYAELYEQLASSKKLAAGSHETSTPGRGRRPAQGSGSA